MENTSGQGHAATVPAEIDRWNWGAFLLNWIWGIENNTFLALLMFVPLVSLVMAFILGAKGSSWAWRNKRWESVEQFRTVQRKWAIWGGILVVASIAACATLLFTVLISLKSSDAFQLSFARLEASREATELLGKPISAGFPMGNVSLNGSSGTASLSYGVNGPRGKGTVFLKATKESGSWQIDSMTLQQDANGRRFELAQ